MEEKDEYIDLSVEQGRKAFKKEIAVEKYHNPTARDYIRNAKEGYKKERAKAKAFYEDKLENKVEGTKAFLKKQVGNMKENKRKGLTLFGNRKLDREQVLGRSGNGINAFGSGNRPFDSIGNRGGGVMNTSGRNVFSGGGSSGGRFAGKVVQKKSMKGKTIVIKL